MLAGHLLVDLRTEEGNMRRQARGAALAFDAGQAMLASTRVTFAQRTALYRCTTLAPAQGRGRLPILVA